MGILSFSPVEATTLHELMIHELKDLYDAEHQLIEALPLMAESSSNPELKKGFQSHLEETKEHVVRLEDVFNLLGEEPERVTCDGMKGLIKEGNHVIESKLRGAVKDAALIGAAQRVEHYEIAAYGTVRTFAEVMGHTDVVELLQKTLDEEGATDKKLTKVAMTVNEKAPAGMAA